MGFRSGSYATVWEVNPVSETMTKVRLSTSKKNKQTDSYETDFSGFVAFVGAAAAKNAAHLKEKDRLKLGDVEVTTKYDKEKKISYTNFTVFSFEVADGGSSSTSSPVEAAIEKVEEVLSDGEVPF